jgi:hypothetical protein
MLKYKSFYFIPLAICFFGCSAVVEVDVDRTNTINVAASGSATVTDVVMIFYGVAEHLGFTVQGPTPGPSYNSTSYDAGPSKTNSLYIDMTIDNNQIVFISHVLSGDLSSAQKAAILFEQGLDKRCIKYYVAQRRDIFQP